VHPCHLSRLVQTPRFGTCGAFHDGVPNLTGEKLILVSGYHEFVSYPVCLDLLLGFYSFVDALRSLFQFIVGRLNSSYASVRSADSVAASLH